MINRIILYVAMASAAFSWGRALYVKGDSPPSAPPPPGPAPGRGGGGAAFSWGRAIYVKGYSPLSASAPSGSAAGRDEEETTYPEAWPVVCSGRVEAVDGEVDIYGQIAGPIAEVRVTEGDFVPKGSVLA